MKQKRENGIRRATALLLLSVFVFMLLPAVSTATGDAPDDWRSYSDLETIVLEDEYGNLTEEDLGVWPVGRYKISIPDVGYVSYGQDGDPLSVSETDENDVYTVIYQLTGDLPNYTLSPGDALYSVAGLPSSSLSSYYLRKDDVVYKNSRKNYTSLNSNNGYYRATQDSAVSIRWYFEPNEDGTFKMALIDTVDPKASNAWKYYAYYDADSGKIRIARDTEGKSTDFRIELVERGTGQFNQYISYGGRITVRLPKAAKTDAGLTDRRAAKWANDLEKAYWYFNDLTNYIPYENIIVKAYADCDYMAYVVSGYNAITVSYSDRETDYGPKKLWFVEDLGEMVARGEEANDWNFGVLHEMGHMFDKDRGWKFETECETDFKLAYCLYRGGASAAPSEMSVSDVFTYDNIEVCYKRLGGNFSRTCSYSAYGAAYKLMVMQKGIGWEPIYRAFHWYSENEALPASERTAIPTNNYGKFQLFIDKVAEYSGVDVQNVYFSDIDWAVFMHEYKNPDYPEAPTLPAPEDGAVRIKVNPSFGGIENYASKTYFIVGISSDNNEEIFTKLRNSSATLKLTLTDETDDVVYTIDRYYFNTPGTEFYPNSFLRLCVCDYGVVPVPGHEYTVLLDIYGGGSRLYTGDSEEGAFVSSQEAFNRDGAVVPANPPYTASVDCRFHTFAAPVFAWNGFTAATLTVTCEKCGQTRSAEAEVTAENGEIRAQATVEGADYLDVRTYVPGDVSGNGSLSINDVSGMLDLLTLSAEAYEDRVASGRLNPFVVDTDSDGVLSISDVAALLDLLA